MTGKERILATMAGQPVDRVPVHHLTFSADAAAAILGRRAYVGGVVMQWWEMQARWEGPGTHAACVGPRRGCVMPWRPASPFSPRGVGEP